MNRNPTTRRAILKAGGGLTLAGAAGVTGARRASRSEDDVGRLRVFGEQEIAHAPRDVHTQGNYAFVANGRGVTVVDWREPAAPEVVAAVAVPGTGVDDVKVDGDVLAASSQAGDDESDVGTHFYDVSNPSAPELLGSFQVLPEGVHNHFLDGDVAYLCKEFPFDEGDLRIVDISDPAQPELLSVWRVEDAHPELDTRVNFPHDVYVQDDLAYVAYWDAGTRVLDVSDPSDPVEVSSFGAAPDADEPTSGELDFGDPSSEFSQRVLGMPGNAHLSRPSPDGDHVYVNAETFLPDDPGPVTVWDVRDLDEPELVATIEAPDVDVEPPETLRTSHNFDVTASRLYTTWYDGGARVFDITEPANPVEVAAFNREGFTFDTVERARSFVLASVRGGGVLWLHDDRGARRPAIDGESTPPRDIVRGRTATE